MFNCKVYQNSGDQEIVLLCKEFKSLNEIATELGLTYAQVADFSSRREKKIIRISSISLKLKSIEYIKIQSN